MRIAIGVILTQGYSAPTEFYFGRADQQGGPEGFIAMMQRLQTGAINQVLPRGRQIDGMRIIKSAKFPTDVARNEICRGVLEGDEDYLLFLDADMVHPADLLERLLAADADVITGRYHIKKAPFAAVAYVKHPTQDGPHRYCTVHFGRGVFEIERGGGGALLIRRDVLQAIHDTQLAQWEAFLESPAYAALPEWMQGYLPRVPIIQWFRYQQGPKAPFDLSVSEDFWFWQQTRETGFTGLCDWDAECQHLAQMAVDRSWQMPFLHESVAPHTDPAARAEVLQNTVIRGYPGGLYLGAQGDTSAPHIPEYVVSGGER